MGSEKDIKLAVGKGCENPFLLLCRNHAAKKPHLEREVTKTVLEVAVVLLGKNRGRSQERNLLTAHDGLECGPEGDLCLSIANIAADQAVHDMGTFHVVLDVLNA